MNAPIEEFGEQNISFITFNYDRRIECFLFTALRHSYRCSDDECKQQVNKIPIVHVHGSLGRLLWQSAEGRTYEPNVTPEAIKIAKDEIKIIHEHVDENKDEDIKKARTLINTAEQIFFLGFGFNLVNMERIKAYDMQCDAFGTSLKLPEIERVILTRSVKRLQLQATDCVSLLRQCGEW